MNQRTLKLKAFWKLWEDNVNLRLQETWLEKIMDLSGS